MFLVKNVHRVFKLLGLRAENISGNQEMFLAKNKIGAGRPADVEPPAGRPVVTPHWDAASSSLWNKSFMRR
jgi:hypothetical protein